MSLSMQYLANARKKSKNFRMPCIYPSDKATCNQKSIDSHNMQENGILSLLSEDGHVYILGESTRNDDDFLLDIKHVGIGSSVSIFRCLCSKHDKEFFSDIEDNPYVCTEKQNFQFALKSLLNAYYNKMRAIAIARPEEKNMNHFKVVYNDKDACEKELNKFWDIKANNNYEQLLTYKIKLPFKIYCAASISINIVRKFDGTLFGEENIDNPLVHISVFPTESNGYILFTTLAENELYFKSFTSQFTMYSTQVITKWMSVLLPLLAEDIALSPILVDNWTKEQKNNILKVFDIRSASFYHTKGISIIGWSSDIDYNIFTL